MLSKTKNLRFINSLVIYLLFTCNTFSIFSQSQTQIIEKIKVDGVASVVGDYVILDSDIDRMYVDMKSQGINTKGVTRCELLSKLMEDKLYAHHAIQDSLEISDQEIYDYVSQSIDYFIEQLGSIEKVLDFYNKPNELSFRDELFEINKIQKLSSLMQNEIIEKTTITPEEVRDFFNSIPKSDLPVFGTELEISQIVIAPEVSDDEKKRIINQLKTFKSDILEGGSRYASKAI